MIDGFCETHQRMGVGKGAIYSLFVNYLTFILDKVVFRKLHRTESVPGVRGRHSNGLNDPILFEVKEQSANQCEEIPSTNKYGETLGFNCC